MIVKKFFIIEKCKYEHINDTYNIHKDKMYDLTTAVKIMLALDTLNEDRERTSYHLQEVSFSKAQEPLELTEDMEVKQEQSEMPF
tara:strand:+ start:177 stop:431 length:255 start_codon:yes stop_codon:yes gene_type:complete